MSPYHGENCGCKGCNYATAQITGFWLAAIVIGGYLLLQWLGVIE